MHDYVYIIDQLTMLDHHSKIAMTGETVKFMCKTNNDVNWTFNEGNLPPNAQKGRLAKTPLSNLWKWNYLIIKGVTEENEGTYACFQDNGNYILYQDEVLLVVKGKKSDPT